jgi:ribonuclease T1
MRPLRPILRQAAGLLLAATIVLAPAGVFARTGPEAFTEIDVAALPPEGRDVLALIRAGGPFPHERDGVVFGNRERLLPAKPRGYYLEYTVRTPGVKSRGARRIVCGGPPTRPDACYYTADHYQSYARIRP